MQTSDKDTGVYIAPEQMDKWVENYRRWFENSVDNGERKRKVQFVTEMLERGEGKYDRLRVLFDNVKPIVCFAMLVAAFQTMADTLIVSDSPTVVRNAEIREAIRQDSTWTSENIAKNPYLFLQDQIANCDKLKAKIDAQNITLVRMEKKANRDAEDAEGMVARYEKFLADAKAAYKTAGEKFPVSVNGYEMDEDEFNEKIDDALTRLEVAKKERKDNMAISKKVNIRKGVLKKKKRELTNLRVKLVQQSEQVKMNAALAEIGSLNDTLGTIKDMMIEIDEDPTKLSVEDMTEEDPNAKRNRRAKSFLKD